MQTISFFFIKTCFPTHSNAHVATAHHVGLLGGNDAVWHQKPLWSHIPRNAESEDSTLGTPLLVQTFHTWPNGNIPWVISLPVAIKHPNYKNLWKENLFWKYFFSKIDHLSPKNGQKRFQHARHTHLACPTAWAKQKLERFFVRTSASPLCEDTQRCHGNGSKRSAVHKPGLNRANKNLFWLLTLLRTRKHSLLLRKCVTNLGLLGFHNTVFFKLRWWKKKHFQFPSSLEKPTGWKVVFWTK